MRLTPDYRVVPWLATRRWFQPPNFLRFHLREEVRMHDGSLLAAEAVRRSVQRLARVGGGTLGVGEGSARVVDDHTADIAPERPNRRLLPQLAHPIRSILAPDPEPAERTVGTGFFRPADHVPGGRLTV